MLGRALILATVMHLIGCLAAAPVHAQATNLEAGKSPSQIFAGTCTACHKSPRGLLKTMPAGSLTGFLRQHYTTSPEMAGLLSSYLVSNGAADTRYQGKPDRDAKSDGNPQGKTGSAPEQLDRHGHRIRAAAPSQEPAKPEAESRQATKPDADGISPQGEPGRKGRNARRLTRPVEEGAKPPEGEAAAQEAGTRGPDGRKLTARQRLSKRGKPGEELPKEMPKGDAAKETDKESGKTDAAKQEPAAAGSAKEDKPAGETKRDEGVKPSGEGKSETAKIEAPKEPTPKEPGGQTPALRADPVPPVTPAPAVAPAASGGTPGPKAASPAAPSASSADRSAATEPVPPAATPASPTGSPVLPTSR